MKKFLQKIFLFFLIIILYKVLLIVLVLFELPELSYGYFLGENIKQNKIVIVGASNIEHNFDYDLLNRSFENYSVVGVSVGLPDGLYPLIYKLKRLDLTENDIIIMSLPYSLYNIDKFLPIYAHNKLHSLKLIKSALQDFPEQTVKTLLKIKLTNFKSSLSSGENDRKYKDYHNNYYGFTKKHDSLFMACSYNEEADFFINDISIQYDQDQILEVKKFLNEEIGSKLFYRYPILKKNQYNLDISKQFFLMKNLYFINTFKSSVFKDDLFYDQWWHLNFCGSTKNTLNFINEISPFLETDEH